MLLLSGDLDFGDEDNPFAPAPPTRAAGKTSPHPAALPPRGSTLQPQPRGAPSFKPVSSHPLRLSGGDSDSLDLGDVSFGSSSSDGGGHRPLSSSRGGGTGPAGVRDVGSIKAVPLVAATRGADPRGTPAAALRESYDTDDIQFSGDDEDSDDEEESGGGGGGRGRPQAGHGGHPAGRPVSALGRHSISHTPSFSSGGE